MIRTEAFFPELLPSRYENERTSDHELNDVDESRYLVSEAYEHDMVTRTIELRMFTGTFVMLQWYTRRFCETGQMQL